MVCGGRVIKSDAGDKCMNSSCDGAKSQSQEHQKQIDCSCGKVMSYQGLNQLGEPLYKCMSCSKTRSL